MSVMEALKKAGKGFGKAQDWATKHFEGTALDMNSGVDITGMDNLSMPGMDMDMGFDLRTHRKSRGHKRKSSSSKHRHRSVTIRFD